MNRIWPLLLLNQYKLDSKYKTDSVKFLIYNQSERTYLLQLSKGQEYKEFKKGTRIKKKNDTSFLSYYLFSSLFIVIWVIRGRSFL